MKFLFLMVPIMLILATLAIMSLLETTRLISIMPLVGLAVLWLGIKAGVHIENKKKGRN